jgi:FAD/FMN-containing dehydrogenase
MTTWTNWAGNVTATPQRYAAPTTIDALRQEVATAAARGWSIRVHGAGHSFAPICATDGLLLNLDHLAGIEAIDPATGDATVLGGTRIFAMGEPLLAAGRALANQGDIDRQAIAGAIATGTHGTGPAFTSFSGAVRAVELVTASGDLVWIDTGDRLRAAALAVGMLGVISRVRLTTVPAYRLRQRTMAFSFAETVAQFPDLTATHRNAEYWWVPPLDQCVVKTFDATTDAPYAPPEEEHPPGTLERYLKPEKVDWGFRVYPSTRTIPFVESEYTLPAAAGPTAIAEVRALMQSRFPDVRWGVEYRTVAADDCLLSPTQGAPSVTISVHQVAEEPYEAFMRATEAIFLAHGGRPHWGKLHWLDRAAIDRLYPAADTFRAIRAGLDPGGVFLNAHLRPLFA